MSDPPIKHEGRLCGAALRKLELRTAYRILEIFQRPFGWVFWWLEQRIARLTDELERRSS